MANVFLSHRTSDMPAAQLLAKDLRALGHIVWIDDDEIGVGDSIVQKINEGLEGATYLVLCLSASGVTAPWTAREWMSTLSRQLSGVNVKILPARLPASDIPAILSDIRYADFTLSWTNGLNQLIAAIR